MECSCVGSLPYRYNFIQACGTRKRTARVPCVIRYPYLHGTGRIAPSTDSGHQTSLVLQPDPLWLPQPFHNLMLLLRLQLLPILLPMALGTPTFSRFRVSLLALLFPHSGSLPCLAFVLSLELAEATNKAWYTWQARFPSRVPLAVSRTFKSSGPALNLFALLLLLVQPTLLYQTALPS